MEPLGDVLSLAVGVLALWIGARLLVTGASRLAESVGISALVVGLTVVAFGTSAPEIVVSTGAALEGRGDVAVGNVVGSNVFNLGVILGLVAIIAPFRVDEPLLRRDVLAMAASTAVAAAVLANVVVSRLEGVILLALLGGYLAALVVAVRSAGDGDAADAGAVSDGAPTADGSGDERAVRFGLEAGRVVAGLALVIVGGRLLVDAAVGLALGVGVSEWVVGATVVAAGTSLPELVTSVVAARRDDMGIAAGNVVGSNVFNVLGVLGLAAAVRPLAVDPAVFLALGWLAALTAFGTAVLATGRQLTRLEGAALVAFGAGYWLVSALA